MKKLVARLFPGAFMILLFACGGRNLQHAETATVTPSAEEVSYEDFLRARAIARTAADSLLEALQDIDYVIQKQGLTVENGIPLSEVYLQMGKAEQAQQALYSVLELHPEDPELFVAMARLFLIRQNYMMCHHYASQAYEKDNTLTTPVFYDGLAYAEEGDTSKAINCFSNVLLVDDAHYEALIQLGLMYSQRGNPLALQYLERALQIQPDSMEALHLLGLFQQESEDYEEALETYGNILAMNPTYVHALYNSGYIYLTTFFNYDSAVSYFDRVVSLEPDYVDALYNLGYSYELRGDFMNARKYFRRVLELNPGYVYAIQGIQRVRK
ncbi:MAG: hypothetical protein CSA95_06115 [Bacteroidetes bacterium]|nr:MAG: hypothetical protein CSA95_06115 [Bacteroidota bacterium]